MKIDRRKFIASTGALAATTILTDPVAAMFNQSSRKKKVALVGTGVRGVNMYGRTLIRNYSDHIEMVGLCDINPGRLEFAKKYIGVDCPTFENFEAMMEKTKPEIVIVTTVDSNHHEFIIKGMEMGADVITEKPMTTDEDKCQEIIDAEKRTGKKTTVTFNYRYSPHRQKMYELINDGAIGDVVSVDFNWYLDVYHGADYFRRWHRLREKGGTLLVHKSTHHFDLLNWWLDSDPEEVFAHGELEHYGKNGPFRHTNCRPCPHKSECKFFWDINQRQHMVDLYVKNEHHDGYLRDGCVFREDVDIFDKMAVQIKYANKIQVSYSLTTYSPYEGYRIAFNGKKGRLEAWIKERQPWEVEDVDELRLTKNFGETEIIRIPHAEGGHGGGDVRLMNSLFIDGTQDPYRQSAGVRDGAMSILTGIAARKSIDSGKPIKIGDLTSINPVAKRPV